MKSSNGAWFMAAVATAALATATAPVFAQDSYVDPWVMKNRAAGKAVWREGDVPLGAVFRGDERYNDGSATRTWTRPTGLALPSCPRGRSSRFGGSSRTRAISSWPFIGVRRMGAPTRLRSTPVCRRLAPEGRHLDRYPLRARRSKPPLDSVTLPSVIPTTACATQS